MTQIRKFVLQQRTLVLMPKGAEVLSVASQGDDICLWAKVNPSAENVTRTFLVVFTGNHFLDEPGLQFIGTVHLHSGAMAVHVFEKL